MQAFIARYYQPILLSLMAVVLGVVFYAGVLEGKSTNEQPVVLACTQNVLDKLSIPVQTLAMGNTPPTTAASAGTTAPQAGMYVGSKNGTKYYSPGCAGAKRISPANYIWFQSAQDAQIQGYTPAAC
jgi:hypothetical protein